ncbi:MAG: hydroxymethylbilane synthase [Euryarchaeota archaeon TMED248]|nr:MAG: hydroxymethylbilane synthase [Euryarchaeota archaeon TMED248]
MKQIRIGTRTSNLAMWQAKRVRDRLEDSGFTTEIVGISSSGDKSLGGDLSSSVGQFIHAVDNELLTNNIDIAVHSSKDVPVEINQKLSNLAYLERGCTSDLLIFPKREGFQTLRDLFNSDKETSIDDALSIIPKSGMVGTVSGRRQSFVLGKRPDIIPIAVRGQVETRLKRLKEGRVDGIILAEIGLKRLFEINVLDSWILEFSAVRIIESEWPTAPGQGSISVHCRSEDFESLKEIRNILNHLETEKDVIKEREILSSLGGGCLYPAGVKVSKEEVFLQVSPKNWKEIFCKGIKFDSLKYNGVVANLEIELPQQEIEKIEIQFEGPKLVSTLNSDRLATVLSNEGINTFNQPVIELVSLEKNWPSNFLDDQTSRSNWPYLVLTSPFAAKCAIEVAEKNGDLSRIQWLAIGEGTARACFMRGVTVSICAKSRNSVELVDFIDKKISREIKLMIPRSNVASQDLVNSLNDLGFSVESWIGYENKSRLIDSIEMNHEDVLLLSSPSSARSWVENSLPIPKNILCMGKASQEEIDSLGYFSKSTVEILQGPTAEYVSKWWKNNRGE